MSTNTYTHVYRAITRTYLCEWCSCDMAMYKYYSIFTSTGLTLSICSLTSQWAIYKKDEGSRLNKRTHPFQCHTIVIKSTKHNAVDWYTIYSAKIKFRDHHSWSPLFEKFTKQKYTKQTVVIVKMMKHKITANAIFYARELNSIHSTYTVDWLIMNIYQIYHVFFIVQLL